MRKHIKLKVIFTGILIILILSTINLAPKTFKAVQYSRLIKKSKNIDPSETEKTLFNASGITSLTEQKVVSFRFDQMSDEINDDGFSLLNLYEKHKEVYEFLFKELYQNNYSEYICDLRELFSSKPKGNCVSFPTAYVLVAENLGLEKKIMNSGSHVFLCFDFNGKRVDIETTEPFGNGFDGEINKNNPCQREVGVSGLAAVMYSNRGRRLISQEMFDQAEEILKKGIESNKDVYMSYLNLGGLYLRKSDENGPAEYFEKVVLYTKKTIDLYPYDPVAYNNLALTRIYQGEYEKAAINLKLAMYVGNKTDLFKGYEEVNKKITSILKQKVPDIDIDEIEIDQNTLNNLNL